MQSIIFDYGGTLDSRGNHWGKVIWRAYQQLAIPVDEAAYRDAYVYAERTLGRNPIVRPSYTFKLTLDVKLRLQLQYLIAHNYWHTDAKSLKNIHKSLLYTLYDETRQIVAESREVLEQLAAQYPLALVSNFYGNIHTVLREMHLDQLFPVVVESAVVGCRKPDPAIFQLAIDRMGVNDPAECLVVGDSMSKDIIPAKSLGCPTVWLRGEGWTDDPVDESIPSAVIDKLEELLNCPLLSVSSP